MTHNGRWVSAGRPRRWLLGGTACGVLVLALVTAGCSSAAHPAGAPAKTTSQAAGPLWLCQPGRAPDPCTDNPAVSAVTASGTVTPAARPSSAAASKFACFYVNPTSSLTQTATGNTSLAVTKLDTYIATEEGAPFSQVCDVWSPLYHSQTFPTVLKGLAGDESLTSLAGTSRTRPVVTEAILPGAVDTGPAWGYHGYEYNLTLGNLLDDVAGEEAAWQSSH